MPSLDVFQTDAFNMMSLTESINKAPFKAKLLGSLGVFSAKPVRTTKVGVEEKQGTLSLISTSARGTVNDVRSAPSRKIRDFRVPHIPYFQTILADDIQNLRAFGSETELEAVASYVNEQLMGMRDDHEQTAEYHRVSALKGILYDGDMSTVIYNWFTEFGITQNTSTFDDSSGDMNAVCNDVLRQMAGALGNDVFGQVYALCGDTYFDKVKQHSSFRNTYLNWTAAEMLQRSSLGPEYYSLAAGGFYWNNIWFINYRGSSGGTKFIDDNDAYYFPTGVPGLFQEVIAPADFMETTNTLGQRFYAKQEPLRFNKGVELHTQSNILSICTRPAAVIKSTWQA